MSTSKFPGFDKIFSIYSSGSTREFIADIELGNADSTNVLRGIETLKQAQARWAMGGKKPGQFIFTRYVSVMMLGTDLLSSLQEAGISGWSTYPVELFGKQGEPLGTYHGLIVHGRCGAMDDSRSVQTTKEFPGGVFPIWRGLYFDEGSWDGSDIFMPSDETRWVFFTARAKRIFTACVKTVQFIALTDIDGFDV